MSSPFAILRTPRGTALALCAAVSLAGAGCDTPSPTESGVGASIDMPVALLSSTQSDVTAIELYVVSENRSTTPRKLATFAGPKWQVRWSGDGRRLAITGNTYAAGTDQSLTASDVWTLNADGTGLQRITNDGMSSSLSWLPDGRLVYSRGPSGGPVQWFAVPAVGGVPVPITLRNGQPVFAPDWSRTAGRMTFTEAATVYTAAIDGTGEAAVASGEVPRWSPGGDRIAYFGNLRGTPTLLIANASGRGAPTAVTTLAQFFNGFAWSQDGTRIAWVRVNAAGLPEAVVGPAAGSAAPTPLVARAPGTVAYDIDLDWRPTARP